MDSPLAVVSGGKYGLHALGRRDGWDFVLHSLKSYTWSVELIPDPVPSRDRPRWEIGFRDDDGAWHGRYCGAYKDEAEARARLRSILGKDDSPPRLGGLIRRYTSRSGERVIESDSQCLDGRVPLFEEDLSAIRAILDRPEFAPRPVEAEDDRGRVPVPALLDIAAACEAEGTPLALPASFVGAECLECGATYPPEKAHLVDRGGMGCYRCNR